MGTIPPIPTFAAGENLTSAKLQQLSAAISFWAAPPRSTVYRNAAANLTTGVWSGTTYDSEVADTDNMHSTVTNASRIVVQTAGTYEVSGQVQIASNATGSRSMTVRTNSAGDTTFATGTSVTIVNVPAVSGQSTSIQFGPLEVAMNVGDYFETFLFQNSGGTLAIVPGPSTYYFRCRLVSTT